MTHTFLRSENKVGAVFLDSRIQDGLSSLNGIWYGHNRRDGSLFAAVWKYRDRSYFKEHPILELSTKGGRAECAVFSAHEGAGRRRLLLVLPRQKNPASLFRFYTQATHPLSPSRAVRLLKS